MWNTSSIAAGVGRRTKHMRQQAAGLSQRGITDAEPDAGGDDAAVSARWL
jgi:hypothetical protein